LDEYQVTINRHSINAFLDHLLSLFNVTVISLRTHRTAIARRRNLSNQSLSNAPLEEIHTSLHVIYVSSNYKPSSQYISRCLILKSRGFLRLILSERDIMNPEGLTLEAPYVLGDGRIPVGDMQIQRHSLVLHRTSTRLAAFKVLHCGRHPFFKYTTTHPSPLTADL
jgi:hypothetical protein